MLIRNPKAFTRGLLLLSSFIVVFVLFFMSIFPSEKTGEKVNGFVYADNMFNTLSKGSSYFFDETLAKKDSVNAVAEKAKGKSIDLTFQMKSTESANRVVAQVTQVGLEASAEDTKLHITGDLYALLSAMIRDAEALYHNDADKIVSYYQDIDDGKLVVKTWWELTSSMTKPLQRADMVDEASIVNTIQTKALEASYNFYGITSMRVKDNIPLVIGFLAFYVIYTMWYGFAIFELFEGIGLTMSKSVKQDD